MAQEERLLHGGAAQVEVAEFEAQIFADAFRVAVVERERRGMGLVEHGDGGAAHFDAAGGDAVVDHVGRTRAHFAGDFHDEFAAAGLRGVPRRLGILRIEHALRDAVAVAQVEENQSAVVAHAVHPAAQFHLRARIGGAQLSARMCPHLHGFVPFSWKIDEPGLYASAAPRANKTGAVRTGPNRTGAPPPGRVRPEVARRRGVGEAKPG